MNSRYPIGKIFNVDRELFPDAEHMIVYLGESKFREGYYKGLMLTHDKRKGNMSMLKEHFSDNFNFENTHVVEVGLLKPQEWEMKEDLGDLSAAGLAWVYQNIIKVNEPENTWDELVPPKKQKAV